jgi:hypothetical protein
MAFPPSKERPVMDKRFIAAYHHQPRIAISSYKV